MSEAKQDNQKPVPDKTHSGDPGEHLPPPDERNPDYTYDDATHNTKDDE